MPDLILQFPQPLAEKYRPWRISEFVGVSEEVEILGAAWAYA